MTASVVGCVYGAHQALVVDIFGGPGGWAEGLRMLGLDEIGIELDPWACATRRAAGHRVIRADVAQMPLDHLAGKVEGLIASPPCQAFSSAGNGEGRDLIGMFVGDIDRGDWTCRNVHGRVGAEVLEIGRWAETIRPTWIACEQVPPVLPVWQAYAARWRALYGWFTWAGVLCAADFGVPQTRRRAILLARTDGRPARPPEPTHSQHPQQSMFTELQPWVSMADALGWAGETEPARTLCGDRSPRWLYPDPDGTHGRIVVRTDNITGVGYDGSQRVKYERAVDQPAPTMSTRGDLWTLNRRQQHDGVPVRNIPIDEPAPTLTGIAGAKSQWVWERPATTIAGDPRLSGPGRNDPDIPGSQYGENSVKLTLTEALILQSFDPGYPVQGNKTAQFSQVGNAVPPLLAAHVLAAVTGRAMEQAS